MPTNILTEAKTCRKCDQNKIYAGGICSSVTGCSTADIINNKSVCMFCDFQKYFEKNPKYSKCICRKGFVLKDGQCNDHCGDGFKILDECDDGNTVNFDGCSSSCEI